MILNRIARMTTNVKPKLDLKGIYPPITTPFNASGDIDYNKLSENLDKFNKVDFRGVVVGGSSGEYVFLSVKERYEVVRFVRSKLGANKLLIAGSGCESTRHTIEMTEAMADAGADAVLVNTPSYYKGAMLKKDVLVSYYKQVADASTVPVLLYSVPVNTQIDLPADTCIELAKHPNIIGMKDSGGDVGKLGYIVSETRHLGFQVMAGSTPYILPSYVLGCVGAVCALANVLGKEICDLFKLCEQGKYEEARELQLKLIKPNDAIGKGYGVPGFKAAMDMVGLYGGPCRSPLLALNATQRNELKSTLSDVSFFK